LKLAAKKRELRPFEQKILLRTLPFEYEPEATAPLFQTYLDEVLPDTNKSIC
jgi:putative DNA primase/helicase